MDKSLIMDKDCNSPSMHSELHPVIHYLDMATTIRNAEIADKAGCAGIFLIHMAGQDSLLDQAAIEIKRAFPRLTIGINRLATDPLTSIRQNVSVGADSTWCDVCGVTSAGVDTLGVSLQTELAKHRGHNLFGSVAFKYQRIDPYPPKAALLAAEAGFIPTTSGTATGSAPEIGKIAAIAAALPNRSLAVASGITPENVSCFVPHVKHFLVSTGISKSFYLFDEAKVRGLIAVLRASG